jgi:multidrug resistance efflux pump
MKKLNALYILFPIAIFLCYKIGTNLGNRVEYEFFGTAESDPVIINFDHDVLIKHCGITIGQEVHKGDTLAILYRSTLDKNINQTIQEIKQLQIEADVKTSLLHKEAELIKQKEIHKVASLQNEIKIAQREDSIKRSLSSTLIKGESMPENILLKEKILSIQRQIKQAAEESKLAEEAINQEVKSNNSLKTNKIQNYQSEINQAQFEKTLLYVISPVDGFVEQLSMSNLLRVQAYKDLIKINPKKANKIIGFIHEGANLHYAIGDTVIITSTLSSSKQIHRGVILSSSPKLIELPYRLRKFTEVRAWGREVYINIPSENNYYIGEKLTLSLSQRDNL